MPFIDDLTGEELESNDDLEYRRQLRDALASGALRGQPEGDGWRISHPDDEAPPPEPVAEVSPQATVAENIPQTPEIEQPDIDEITQRAADEAVGLNDRTRTIDYVSRTAGVTESLGQDSERVAKYLSDALDNLNTGEPGIAAIRQGALEQFREGLDLSKNPIKAWDNMVDFLRESLGKDDPRVRAVIRGGAGQNYDPATGTYRSGDEHVDASARGRLRGERQANAQGQYTSVGDALTQLSAVDIPYSKRARAFVGTAVEDTWNATPLGVANNALLTVISRVTGVDLPDSGEIVGGAVSELVPTTVGAAAVTALPGVGDLRGGVSALKGLRAGQTVKAALLGEEALAKTALPAATGKWLFENAQGPRTPEQAAKIAGYALDEITMVAKSGKEAPHIGISAEAARILQAGWQRVANAAPNDMVTVYLGTNEDEAMQTLYHWTPDQNVDSIRATGLRAGSWLADSPEAAVNQARLPGLRGGGTVLPVNVRPDDVQSARGVLTRAPAFRSKGVLFTDPDQALLHAVGEGSETPTLMGFRVKRSELSQIADSIGFKGKGPMSPIFNGATDGRVPNAYSKVKEFLREGLNNTTSGRGLAGERGSFLTPGAPEGAVPDDVSRLAFGEDALKNAADQPRGTSINPDTGQLYTPDEELSYGDVMIDRTMDLENAAWKMSQQETDKVSSGYDRAQRAASFHQEKLDEAEAVVNNYHEKYGLRPESTPENPDAYNKWGSDNYGERFAYENAKSAMAENKEKLYRSLADAQKFGEEMYVRTDGKGGMMPRIQRAIKQFLAEEEGTVRIPDLFGKLQRGEDYVLSPITNAGAGAVKTVAYLGVKPIVPHMRPIDHFGNFFHTITMNGRATRANPLSTQLILEKRAVEHNADSNAADRISQIVEHARRNFEADDDGFIKEFLHPQPGEAPARITLQDLAAKWATYRQILKPEQNSALERINELLRPMHEALEEQGVKFGIRPDIEPGGFYIPRGDAFEDGFDKGENYLDYGVRPPKRSVKTGAEKAAYYETMADGVDAGKSYHNIFDTMTTHFRRMNERVINSYFSNVMLTATDRDGVLLADDVNIRLKRDFPDLVKDIATLRKQVTSLDKSIDRLDIKTRETLLDFIYSPNPDLSDLKNVVNSMATQKGTLRIRDPYNLQDHQADFKYIYDQVQHELFVSKGKYKGLTGEAARKEAIKDKTESLSILRGRFKGMDYDMAHKTLDDIKATLQTLEPLWAAAKKDAAFTGLDDAAERGGVTATGFGTQLQGTTFPQVVSAVFNKHFKEQRWNDVDAIKAYNVINGFFKFIGAGSDFSALGIQGALSSTHETKNYLRATYGMGKAMLTPDGARVHGAYLIDFNKKAIREGLPTSEEWAAAGLHVGGAKSEVSSGIGLLPFRRGDIGFGYFGDILRMDGAQAIFKSEINKASNAGKSWTEIQREIAKSQNLMTGQSLNAVGGKYGNYFFFAPRFFNSQFELLHAAITASDRNITGKEARSLMRNYLGTAVMVTAAANVAANNEDFDWLSLEVNGHPNPNFMRIRTGVPGMGDVSLLGPYDSLLKMMINAKNGDFKALARSKLSPVMSQLWNEISGENYKGENLPRLTGQAAEISKRLSNAAVGTEFETNADWKPSVLGERAMRDLLPFAYADPIADAATGKTSITEAIGQGAVGAVGIKASPLSPSETLTQKRNTIRDELIADGTIPADMVETFKNTDYYELPSYAKKLLDRETEKRNPELYKEIRQSKLDRGDIFTTRSESADQSRKEYGDKYDDLLKRLMAGENPYTVWKAYEDNKNQLTGALGKIYGGAKPEFWDKNAAEYRKSVDGLPISDNRRLEDAYNSIMFSLGKDIAAYTADDWDKVERMQLAFRANLSSTMPDAAKLFEYNMKLKEQFSMEDAHPLVALRKAAQTQLAPYYEIRDDIGKGLIDPEEGSRWLRANPQADYLRFLTQKPLTPDSEVTLNSVEAATMALNIFGKTEREIRLVGTKQNITVDNLPVFQQYANEIMQLFEVPTSKQLGGNKTFPRTELRKRDAKYDAISFWLGMYDTVYHLDYVNQWVGRVGGRKDGKKPKAAS